VTSLSVDLLKPGTPFDRSFSVGNARKEYFSEKCSFDDACHSISVWRGNNMYLCFKSGQIFSKVFVTLLRWGSGWRMPQEAQINLGRGSAFKEGVPPDWSGEPPGYRNRRLISLYALQ